MGVVRGVLSGSCLVVRSMVRDLYGTHPPWHECIMVCAWWYALWCVISMVCDHHGMCSSMDVISMECDPHGMRSLMDASSMGCDLHGARAWGPSSQGPSTQFLGNFFKTALSATWRGALRLGRWASIQVPRAHSAVTRAFFFEPCTPD